MSVWYNKNKQKIMSKNKSDVKKCCYLTVKNKVEKEKTFGKLL